MQKITKVYIWDTDPGKVDVCIQRQGDRGFSEHTYLNISEDSITRLFHATPDNHVMTEDEMHLYDLEN